MKKQYYSWRRNAIIGTLTRALNFLDSTDRRVLREDERILLGKIKFLLSDLKNLIKFNGNKIEEDGQLREN